MSNREKIEQQTNLLNTEWAKLRIQSTPLSTSAGALTNKKVCLPLCVEYVSLKLMTQYHKLSLKLFHHNFRIYYFIFTNIIAVGHKVAQGVSIFTLTLILSFRTVASNSPQVGHGLIITVIQSHHLLPVLTLSVLPLHHFSCPPSLTRLSSFSINTSPCQSC